jgi:hypothetical protein
VQVDLDERLDLADGVFRAAEGLLPGVLPIMASVLVLNGGLVEVGEAFDSFAGGSPDLARLQLARALDRLARFGDRHLIERLGAAEAEPWRALALAVAELRN